MASAEGEQSLESSVIEAIAAEEVDDGECQYTNCDRDADLRVEFRLGFAGSVTHETALMCDLCNRQNAIHARANDLLDHEVSS